MLALIDDEDYIYSMFKSVRIGLERLPEMRKSLPVGESPALLGSVASVSGDLCASIDFLLGNGIPIGSIFGPQHGYLVTDQANMVEWDGAVDRRTGLRIHSLYGKNRRPTPEMLDGVSSLIIDLQDIGARYYTYIWTALLCLRACAKKGIPVIVLDRPNPIDGVTLEGPGISNDFESFVGLSSIPIRHGCTIGELMRIFARREGFENALHVVGMEGWSRGMRWPDTGLPWVSPSPNMPNFSTAALYPGGCLIEGTNLSEGRGTTLPFHLVGAPWSDGYDLAAALDAEEKLSGVAFRPTTFKPCFDKFAGRICNGIQIHIVDYSLFEPVLTFYSIIRNFKRLFPGDFRWASPPYEYEFEKPPIDILAGGPQIRESVEADVPGTELKSIWQGFTEQFESERREGLLY